MPQPAFSTAYLASQAAGSCRIEGIQVSVAQEQRMRDVIDGKTDAKALRLRMTRQFKTANRRQLATR